MDTIAIGTTAVPLRPSAVARSIGSIASTVAFWTALVYAATAVKEMVIGYRLGASSDLDAFLIAQSIPVFAVSVFANSFSTALIPAWARRPGIAFHESACALAGALLLAVVVLLALSASQTVPWLATGFTVDQRSFAVLLYLLLLPAVIFRGLAKCWGAMLNAENRYSAVAASPLATPVLMAAGVWMVPGVAGLVAGMLAGGAAELLVVGSALRKTGFPLRPRWHGVTADLWRAANQYGAAAASASLMAGSLLIDQAFAATLGPGSVSIFAFGTYPVIFLQQLAAVALATAMMPAASRLAAAGDFGRLRITFTRCAWRIAGFGVPCAIVVWYYSGDLTALLWQRGAFTTADAGRVADVQRYYALQIPFYVLNVLVVRQLSAIQANHVLIAGAAVFLGVNAALDWALSRTMGVAGIGLATTVTYVLCFVFHLLWLNRSLRIAERGFSQ